MTRKPLPEVAISLTVNWPDGTTTSWRRETTLADCRHDLELLKREVVAEATRHALAPEPANPISGVPVRPGPVPGGGENRLLGGTR